MLRHRRPVLLSLVIALLWSATTVSAGLAAAAGDPLRFAAGTPSEAVVKHFAGIPLGENTETIVLDPGLGPGRDFVQCSFPLTHPAPAYTWSPEEWYPPTDLTLLPGDVVAGSPFVLACDSGGSGYPAWSFSWDFDTIATAGRTVDAVDDPTHLVDESRDLIYGDRYADPVGLRAGSAVEIYGDPGTWVGATATGTIEQQPNPATGTAALTGSVSADGSSLTFVVPTDLDPSFYSIDAKISISSTTEAVATTWQQTVRITDPDATTTRVAVSSTTATSFQHVKTIVRVESVSGVPASGRVAVFVDGLEAASATLDGENRVVLTLPRQPRGRHIVTATFDGGSSFGSSTGNRALLRILI